MYSNQKNYLSNLEKCKKPQFPIFRAPIPNSPNITNFTYYLALKNGEIRGEFIFFAGKVGGEQFVLVLAVRAEHSRTPLVYCLKGIE